MLGPHPRPFSNRKRSFREHRNDPSIRKRSSWEHQDAPSQREKGVKPLALWERGWGEGMRRLMGRFRHFGFRFTRWLK
ncbi:protein of unknown function [Methylocaldum szegediense]|uniref:Uncharacterized protein n=2 Tax=Methylocaldum szegediense TaxID=73780 RepID=A0ABN8X1T9_9GAMM|nr:protein of unknown function [Methylocaldum szegediense]